MSRFCVRDRSLGYCTTISSVPQVLSRTPSELFGLEVEIAGGIAQRDSILRLNERDDCRGSQLCEKTSFCGGLSLVLSLVVGFSFSLEIDHLLGDL